MAGWFPAGADSWKLVVELLTERGEPWPYDLILDDLAWWADGERVGRGKRPGRPRLMRRWRVTERIARKAMADPSWRNRQRPADVQPMSSRCPADVQPPPERTPTIEQKSPADVQPMSSSGPADVLTRVDPPTPTPDTPPEQQDVAEGRRRDIQQAYDDLRKRWAKPPASYRTLKPKAHPGVAAKTNGEAMYDLITDPDRARRAVATLAWLSESSHDRAVTYREKGFELITVRRKLDVLYELSLDHPAKPGEYTQGSGRKSDTFDWGSFVPEGDSPDVIDVEYQEVR